MMFSVLPIAIGIMILQHAYAFFMGPICNSYFAFTKNMPYIIIINKNKNNTQIQLILIINSIEVKLKDEFKGDILAHLSHRLVR